MVEESAQWRLGVKLALFHQVQADSSGFVVDRRLVETAKDHDQTPYIQISRGYRKS